MSKILFLINSDSGLYQFRLELLEELLKQNHEVIIATPKGDYTDKFIEMGCRIRFTNLSRHGKNIFQELKLLKTYKKILKEEKPDVVLTYTIKPNIYGGIACRALKIPYIANVTGLGDAIENGGFLSKISLFLYKRGLKKANCVFFQNKANQTFFTNKHIISTKYDLLPGSGVNLERFSYLDYPQEEEVRIVFVGRITRDKGVFELAKAIEIITEKNNNVFFDIVGRIDENCENPFQGLKGCQYHGEQSDVRPFLKNAHAIVLPSYHEGMANVLLEAAACGRVVLASNVPGCIETFDEGISGFSFKVKDVEDLTKTIEKFIDTSYNKKVEMGKAGRNKVENQFDRRIVVEKYLEQINLIK